MPDFSRSVLFCLTVASLSGSGGSVELSVRPQGGIREGDSIHISCATKHKDRFDVLKLVKQVNQTEFAITTNNFVEERFRSTGRYRISQWNDTGLVELQITHVRGVDAGNIGCRHLQSKKSAFVDVIVNVAVSSVELRYQGIDGRWHRTPDHGRIQATGNVSCNVTVIGSNFRPEVVITIGGVEVTSRFHRKFIATEENDDGFVKYYYSADHVANLVDIEAASAGKNLTCWAKTEQHNPKSASAIIEMTQSPILKCVKVWYGLIGQSNLTLTCHGKMDPGPKRVVWSASQKQLVVSSVGSSNRLEDSYTLGGRFASKARSSDSGRWEFDLTISQLTLDDFAEYILEVTNDVGFSSVSIDIMEEEAEAVHNQPVQKAQHVPDTGVSLLKFPEAASDSSAANFKDHPSFLSTLAFASIVVCLFLSD